MEAQPGGLSNSSFDHTSTQSKVEKLLHDITNLQTDLLDHYILRQSLMDRSRKLHDFLLVSSPSCSVPEPEEVEIVVDGTSPLSPAPAPSPRPQSQPQKNNFVTKEEFTTSIQSLLLPHAASLSTESTLLIQQTLLSLVDDEISRRALRPSLPLLQQINPHDTSCATVQTTLAEIDRKVHEKLFDTMSVANTNTTYVDISKKSQVVLSKTSKTFTPKKHKIFSSDFLHEILQMRTEIGPPDEVLKPSLAQGRCWAMDGHDGHVVIELPKATTVSAISLNHVFVKGHNSAPRAFRVFGFEEDFSKTETGVLLGSFEYENVEEGDDEIGDGDEGNDEIVGSLQTFHLDLDAQEKEIRFLKLKVESNFGNEDYTCIYRLHIWEDLKI